MKVMITSIKNTLFCTTVRWNQVEINNNFTTWGIQIAKALDTFHHVLMLFRLLGDRVYGGQGGYDNTGATWDKIATRISLKKTFTI